MMQVKRCEYCDAGIVPPMMAGNIRDRPKEQDLAVTVTEIPSNARLESGKRSFHGHVHLGTSLAFGKL